MRASSQGSTCLVADANRLIVGAPESISQHERRQRMDSARHTMTRLPTSAMGYDFSRQRASLRHP